MAKAPQIAIAEYSLADGNTYKSASGASPSETVGTIALSINDNQNITVQRVRATMTAEGCTWSGVVQETGESALLMWWKDGRLTGVLSYKGRVYRIMNTGEEVHAEIEAKPRKMPSDHASVSFEQSADTDLRNNHVAARSERTTRWPPMPAAVPPEVKPFSDVARRALEANKISIDLMLLYTKRAASRYIINLPDLIALAVEQVNQTFRNSGLDNISLRLVDTQLIDYDETDAGHFEHLYRLVDGIGPFKEVRKLRDKKRADIVGMILEDPSGCGLTTRIAPDSEEAYFVVHHSCAAIMMSIAHEVGHILGARHDLQTDAINSPFPYGHGYVNGTKWRDIMSYQQSCDGCPRIPHWSNPRVKYNGEPTGTNTKDNARVILEQAERVSRFR
jgi:hypothetical protein